MGSKKILVVDDDEAIRRAMHIRLQASGYDVAVATDAISAVSVAQKERPDLIILDVNMPGGNGFIVMERMQKITHLALTPIIVVTGGDPFIYRDKAFERGAVDFFEKPVDNEVLLAAIRRQLGESDQGPNQVTSDT